jgi:4'-phosphopantetheinyl transferase
LIICGVISSTEIGVDVENLHRNDDSIIDIADRYFSKTEVEALNQLPVNQKKSRFFDYWTLKESFIKVVGLGLSFPLDEFSFVIGEQNNPVTGQGKGTQKKENQEQPLCNSNIRLSVDTKRPEQGEDYLSWLLYPNEQHRIAITVENKKRVAESEFSMRFFETVPLEGFREVALLAEGI